MLIRLINEQDRDEWLRMRQQYPGAQLVRAAEARAREQGVEEWASDCLIDEDISMRAHASSGFQEVEQLIHFRKIL